jgi:hypothetical protein
VNSSQPPSLTRSSQPGGRTRVRPAHRVSRPTDLPTWRSITRGAPPRTPLRMDSRRRRGFNPGRPASARGRAGHSSIAANLPSVTPQVQVERPQRSEDERPGGAARRRPYLATRKATGQRSLTNSQRPRRTPVSLEQDRRRPLGTKRRRYASRPCLCLFPAAAPISGHQAAVPVALAHGPGVSCHDPEDFAYRWVQNLCTVKFSSRSWDSGENNDAGANADPGDMRAASARRA